MCTISPSPCSIARIIYIVLTIEKPASTFSYSKFDARAMSCTEHSFADNLKIDAATWVKSPDPDLVSFNSEGKGGTERSRF